MTPAFPISKAIAAATTLIFSGFGAPAGDAIKPEPRHPRNPQPDYRSHRGAKWIYAPGAYRPGKVLRDATGRRYQVQGDHSLRRVG